MLGVGNDGISSDLEEASRDGDVMGNEESVIGTNESESTRGEEESDEENNVEGRDAMVDTDLDVEEFAKGVRADEQNMGGDSLGDDGEAMGGDENKPRGEPNIEGDPVGLCQSQEEPAVQTHGAEDEVIEGSSENTINGEEMGSALQEEGLAINASPIEDVVADGEAGIERAAKEEATAPEDRRDTPVANAHFSHP